MATDEQKLEEKIRETAQLTPRQLRAREIKRVFLRVEIIIGIIKV